MKNRESTRELYIERISAVLQHIEANFGKRLCIEELASIAGFSCFHFHRIFMSYVGESPASYMRRLMLEKSARSLKYHNENITEVALTHGFETPSSYTKAFKNVFGVSPSEYKAEHRASIMNKLKNFDYSRLQEIVMKNYIETKTIEDMRVLYVRKTGDYGTAASEAWPVLMKFCYSNKIMLAGTKCMGLSYDDPTVTPVEKLRYDACITYNGEIEPTGEVGVQTIKGGRYAVFLHKGAYKELAKTYQAIFREWLPNSGETLADIPCFEQYMNRDPRRTKPENLRTEIYIPLK